MTDIIDIHSHILPGIDDGADSVREAVDMLKEASKQGITKIIATPHFSKSFPNRCPERICRFCTLLEKRAKEAGVSVHILPGQEIFYTDGMLGLLDKGELLTLADSRYVLVEFYPGSAYSDIYRVVRELVIQQYYPVLAHVERYHNLRKVERIEELKEQGAYIQMNYQSIAGNRFKEQTRWCRRLLKEERIHLMGTDMHHIDRRTPDISAALSWMKKHLDEEYLEMITQKNAEKILKNEKMQ